MTAVLYIFLSILCLVGLASVLRAVVFSIFNCKNENSLVHVIVLNSDNPEAQIRSAVERLQMSGLDSRGIVYALDGGLRDEAVQISNLLLRDCNIPLCTAEDLGKAINERI